MPINASVRNAGTLAANIRANPYLYLFMFVVICIVGWWVEHIIRRALRAARTAVSDWLYNATPNVPFNVGAVLASLFGRLVCFFILGFVTWGLIRNPIFSTAGAYPLVELGAVNDLIIFGLLAIGWLAYAVSNVRWLWQVSRCAGFWRSRRGDRHCRGCPKAAAWYDREDFLHKPKVSCWGR